MRSPSSRNTVLIAPDKFKGCLTAQEVASALAARIRDARGDMDALTVPIADGGEGTVDAALAAGFHPLHIVVPGPLGDPVDATVAMRHTTAVIELAQAAGLALLPPSGPTAQTAKAATTFGVGKMMAAALDAGAQTLVLGLGGSASTDGGAGLLQALGRASPTPPVRFSAAGRRTR